MALTDLYVYDKDRKEIHRIGDNPHDSLYFHPERGVCYYNLQNGCGCSMQEDSGNYAFVASEHGFLEGEFGIIDKHYKEAVSAYIKKIEDAPSSGELGDCAWK